MAFIFSFYLFLTKFQILKLYIYNLKKEGYIKELKFENKDFILEMINGMTLYSPFLIEAFKSKALIREVLSLVEMPFKLPENDDEL